MDSSYTPASTIEKISMIKELKKICDDILNEYQEFRNLSQECWEISSLIPAKKQEILDLSAKNVEPFHDDEQKALYELQHKNQELTKLREDVEKAMKKCKEQRQKIDRTYQWPLGKIINKFRSYDYLKYSQILQTYYLPIFGDS
ncbi:hypothetical protein M9Y10_013753 [Tritrichomonas musculus]|uniref:Uncharacterized protein n=1 Tax=Tritrichomonas musculus TaxID=1915356 RepID=A0ABR2KXQ8_9EUKA